MDDLISRADAIAVVRYCKEDPIKNLEALPGVGWIQVTERLPDKFQYVLVYLICEGIGGAVCMAERKENGLWYGTAQYSLPLETSREKVTHWMPLPEPPAEVE